ncbi:MAG: hypothetical protein Q9182_000838 [Xanthomendoza sp. 2 TL-2023]
MSSLQQATLLNPPPDGNTSNGASILIITWLFTSISAIIVILKVYTRLQIIQQFGADDILTIIALLFLLTFAPLITVSVSEGLGKHVFYLTPTARIQCSKLAILSNPLVFLASSWPNVSVAISLNRILVPQPWQVGVLYGIPILQCAFAFISSIVTYNQCSPLEGLWNPLMAQKYTCLPSALSAFTHVFLAVVPIFGLWTIRIKTKTKVGVCLLMSTTAIAAIAAIIRTIHLKDPELSTDLPRPIEATFIISAACIPSLRPFIRTLSKSLDTLFVIPTGYHHSHSRRHRPRPLVPRESGSGNTSAMTSPNVAVGEEGGEKGDGDGEGGRVEMRGGGLR